LARGLRARLARQITKGRAFLRDPSERAVVEARPAG